MPNLTKQECTVLFNVVVNDERSAERSFHRFVLTAETGKSGFAASAGVDSVV